MRGNKLPMNALTLSVTGWLAKAWRWLVGRAVPCAPPAPPNAWDERLERAEGQLLELPQVECPVTNHFAPHVYLREIFMPAGAIIIGHKHRTRHFNVVLSGRATVMMDGVIHDIVAPCIFVSEPGVRKVLHIVEDMRWATVHPSEETDLTRLEAQLIVKSNAWLDHQNQQDAAALIARAKAKGELCHG